MSGRVLGAQRIFTESELWEELEIGDAAHRLDWSPAPGERVWVMVASRNSDGRAEPRYRPGIVSDMDAIQERPFVWTYVTRHEKAPGVVSAAQLRPRSWTFPEDEDAD